MNHGRSAFALIIALSLTGCSATWVDTNNSKATSEKIEAAKEICQMREKLEQLRVKEMTIDILKIKADTSEAKDELDKVYQHSEQQITAEIEECMQGQGLMRAE